MKRIGLITQVNCHMGKDLISCGYISYRGDIVRFYPDEYMGDPLQYHDIVTFEFAPSEGDFEVAENIKLFANDETFCEEINSDEKSYDR